MAKLTNQFQWTRHTTSSPDKHYSLDSEDEFRSGGRNVSHQQQFFSELPSPGRSQYTNYWYSWVQTIYKNYDVKTNISHAEKIKKFSEDSEHNFEGGADSELDKDTDRSNLK